MVSFESHESPWIVRLNCRTGRSLSAPHKRELADRAGATLHEVKEILGHSQIVLTANLSGHAYLAVKREVLTRVDSMLNSMALSSPGRT